MKENNKNKISVSIMCSDLLNLEQEINILKSNKIDYLHVDVMDAHLVPNLTFGPDFIKAMHKKAHIPLDIHLMLDNPEWFLSQIVLKQNDILSIHVELGCDVKEISKKVHKAKAKFGLAINPETPISSIEPYLPHIDVVLLMLVSPGFAKGTIVKGIMEKVAKTRDYLNEHNYPNILISVDGSVNWERAHEMAHMGANIFVGGTAGIYRKNSTIDTCITSFRKAIS